MAAAKKLGTKGGSKVRSSGLLEVILCRRLNIHHSKQMKPKHKRSPWLRPKQHSGGMNVGVGWYTEEEWSKVKAAATDPERFEETYAEWVQVAESALAELHAAGVNAEKCHVVAEELLAWCLAHGKPNDGATRAEFVSEQGRQSR